MLTLHLLTMAWRNLWRNGRRTALTLVSIAFGGFLAVMLTGFQDRSFAAVIDRAARFGGGHVTFQHAAYQDVPTVSNTVHGTAELRARALADPAVERAVERISGHAMVATASGSYGAQLVAYDPSTEDQVTLELADKLHQGRLFVASSEPGIVLGDRLAANLEVALGDKVVYTLTNKQGDIVSGMGRVLGLVRTGSPAVDAGLFVLTLDTARELLGYAQDEATQVAVFIRDARYAPRVAARIRDRSSADATLTWREAQPQLASFIAMKIGAGRAMEGVIFLVVAAGIFNTLFMSVMERTRELGILLAIGYTPAHIRALILFESLWLAVLGLLIGALLTSWPYVRLARTGLDMRTLTGSDGAMEAAGVPFDPVLPFGAFPENLALIVSVVFITTVAAGILPAWRAGRIQPVDSLKLV